MALKFACGFGAGSHCGAPGALKGLTLLPHPVCRPTAGLALSNPDTAAVLSGSAPIRREENGGVYSTNPALSSLSDHAASGQDSGESRAVGPRV